MKPATGAQRGETRVCRGRLMVVVVMVVKKQKKQHHSSHIQECSLHP